MKQNIRIDYESLVSQADLYYDKPVEKRYQGMPIGNGVTGSMVWTENQKIGLQINRVDVFATNGATTAGDCTMGSPAYLGKNEYCGGCAFCDIDFSTDIFTKDHTQQHLSFYDATLSLKGKNVSAQLKVWSENDVFLIDVQDERITQNEVKITLKMLREAYTEIKNHKSKSRVFSSDDTIYLSQEFYEECSTGISENDHYCASCVTAYVSGCEIKDIKIDENSCITLIVIPKIKNYQIYIASGADFSSVQNARKNSELVLKSAVKASPENIRTSHLKWWHSYWEKSYIHTPCNNDFTLYWYTYLYYIGCTMRGNYPAKYNGLLFNCGGDNRCWGGQYWWYNQSRSHYGLDIANHGDMNKPLFNMLLNNIPKYKTACEQQFGGNGGIYFPETEAFSGPEVLPDNIASDLKNVLLYDNPATKNLLDFMKDRSGMNSRWCLFHSRENQEKGNVQHFRWHSNLSYNAGDIANTMWGHFLYTMDKNILKQIYPWLKGVAEFYRFHPCLKLEQDGYYHIEHLGWAESITYAKDIIDDIVIMKGIYPTVIKASEILEIDEDMRSGWVDMTKRTPPYPTSAMEDSISNKYHKDGFTTYSIGRKPCNILSDGNSNDCRMRMLFSFDLINLETRETNPEEFEIANHSFESLPIAQSLMKGEQSTSQNIGYVWNRALVKAARLGRTDIVRTGLPAQLKQFKTPTFSSGKIHYPNRLPWTNSHESYSIQEIGVFSDQLQEPLLQSIANGAGSTNHVIYVFPAWPIEWDASFDLRAKGAFMVNSKLENKEIQYVKITSEEGKRCSLHNPWFNENVDVWYNDQLLESYSGKTVEFDTVKDGEYLIIKANSLKNLNVLVRMPNRIYTDQITVTKQFYDSVPMIAPNEKTKLMLIDNDDVVFVSSNEQAVKILDNNVLVGISCGISKITAYVNGTEIAQISVKVANPVINDSDKKIVYSNGWKHKWYTFDGSYYDDYHYTDKKGAYAELEFEGTAIEIYGIRSNEFSKAEIYIDGIYSAQVDCSAHETNTNQLIYRNRNLQGKKHIIRIVSCSSKTIALDYFRVII